jgi:hypothetical protein
MTMRRMAAALLAAGLALGGCGGGSSGAGADSSDATDQPSTDSSSLSLSDPDVEASAFDPCILTAREISAAVGFEVADGTMSKGSLDDIKADECSYSAADGLAGTVSVQSIYGDTLKAVADENIVTARLFGGKVDLTPVPGLPASFVTDVLDAQTVFSIGPSPLAVSVNLDRSQGRPAELAASVAVAKAVAAAL